MYKYCTQPCYRPAFNVLSDNDFPYNYAYFLQISRYISILYPVGNLFKQDSKHPVVLMSMNMKNTAEQTTCLDSQCQQMHWAILYYKL